MKLQKKESKIIITRLDQSNVLDWKVSSILLKTKFFVSHVMLNTDAGHQSDFAYADSSSILK